MHKQPASVIVVIGTRPEFIKLAPLLLELRRQGVRARGFITRQHSTMLQGLDTFFGLTDLDYALETEIGSDLNTRILAFWAHCAAFFQVFEPKESVVVVQGDTASALAGAMAGFHLGLNVAHVEAGLRSGDRNHPYPEESYRKIISQLAHRHYAPTELNKQNLLKEGINARDVVVTGNTVVDSLIFALESDTPARAMELTTLVPARFILFTGHRRENQDFVLEEALRQILETLVRNPDLGCIFPAHLSPRVQKIASSVEAATGRLVVCPPLEYPDFVFLANRADLIISDSGGIQEEAATLGTRVLVIRKTTERPEAVDAGVVELVPEVRNLREKIEWHLANRPKDASPIENPFGDGRAAERITRDLLAWKVEN